MCLSAAVRLRRSTSSVESLTSKPISYFSCSELRVPSGRLKCLHLRSSWSPAWGVTRAQWAPGFQFIPIFPCFSPMFATHTQEGNAVTSSPEGQGFHLHRHTVRRIAPLCSSLGLTTSFEQTNRTSGCSAVLGLLICHSLPFLVMRARAPTVAL